MSNNNSNINDRDKIEKRRHRNPIYWGIGLAAAGLLLGLAASLGDDMAFLPIFLAFGGIGAVVMVIGLKRVKYEDEADVPGTSAYDKHNASLRKKAQIFYDKLYTHRSLHDEFSFAKMALSGGIFGVLFLITVVMFFAGYYSVLVLIGDVCVLVVFIYCLTGKPYRSLIALYAPYSADETEAARDFETSAYVNDMTGKMAMGKVYCIVTQPKERVFRREEILWIFPRLRYVYNYMNGIYTGRSEKASLLFCLKNGDMVEGEIERAACIAMLRKAHEDGIICGYSRELCDLYMDNRETFPEAYAAMENKPRFDDFLMPTQ